MSSRMRDVQCRSVQHVTTPRVDLDQVLHRTICRLGCAGSDFRLQLVPERGRDMAGGFAAFPSIALPPTRIDYHLERDGGHDGRAQDHQSGDTDSRRNKEVRIDPQMIERVWELYRDLGATQPIRSSPVIAPATNSIFRRQQRDRPLQPADPAGDHLHILRIAQRSAPLFGCNVAASAITVIHLHSCRRRKHPSFAAMRL